MPRPRKEKRCKECGSTHNISQQYLCRECAWKHIAANTQQMRNKQGPYYEKWKAGMLAALNRKELLAEKLSRRWVVGIEQSLRGEAK